MAYEIFPKMTVRVTTPAITINRRDRNHFVLNTQAAMILHQQDINFVLLLWDMQTSRVALRPSTNKNHLAYKLTYGKVVNSRPNGATISARALLNHVGWKTQDQKRIIAATWNKDEQIMEFMLPVDCLETR